MRHNDGQTLQPTALVNEAFLRLINLQRMRWQDRAHFLAMSARIMRRILIDHARARGYKKRGGGTPKVSLESVDLAAPERDADIVALDAALEALAKAHPRKAMVVEMRFFGGLSAEETAKVLKVSPDTVLRDWRFAKAWLLEELRMRK